MELSVNTQKPSFFILFLLISFASISAIFYTPALPAIAQFFHITADHAQLTLILYLVGFAVGQLCYGPISNRYGRKPVVCFGLFLAVLSSFLCGLSAEFHAFWLLLVFRMMQAMGACVGMMMTFTIVADYYKTGTARINTLLILSIAVLPPVATVIGGFIVQHVNWQACFYFITVYGIFVLLLCLRLPETCPQVDRHALKVGNIIRGYLAQLTHSQFMLFSIFMGCVTSIVYIFAAESPFIAIHLMGLSPSAYGVWVLLPYLGLAISCLVSAKLAHRVKLTRMIRIGMTAILFFSLVMWFCFSRGWVNEFSLFFLTGFIFFFEIFVFANSATLATLISENKSNASAVMNFFNVGIPVIALQMFGLVPGVDPTAMPIGLTLLMLIVIVLSFFIKVDY